jgi:long-chain acyl-CoA synthetase
MLVNGSELQRPAPPLDALLAAGLAADPDAVAVTSAEDELTWRELDDRAAALAAGYLDLGLGPGDRLASLMPNRTGLLVHYLACFRSGLVATPLNYRYTAREIDHALSVSGAAAIVAHAERDADLAESDLAGALRLGTIRYGAAEPAGTRLEDLMAGERPERPPPAPSPGDPAAIFFTSGSTGPAKGVTHTHETLRWMMASAAEAFGLASDDVFLPGSSMSHIGSFLWSLTTLSVGGRVVIARTFDSHEILPLLRAHKPTVLAMIPAALAALIRDHDLGPDDFESLRICRAGADKVSTELLREFAEAAGFPIDEGYGMTEVGLATLNPPSGVIKQGSIGPPIAGFSIEIRNEDGGICGAETVGRVWIRSRSRMQGYWQAPDATEEVVSGSWLDSGDLARCDDDGYLWFFGRKKQVIVHDGSNISPLEVESALMEHPAVDLAGVVGIHDAVHGENVRAYVTLRADVPAPSSAELIVHCRERIGYKAPEEVVVIDQIPLNPTGKIDRPALKRMAEDHLHPHR